MNIPIDNRIKRQFDDVIRFSQGIEKPCTDALFADWSENKAQFYHLLGNELIYEYPYPVSFDLNDYEKENNLDDFIDLITTNYSYDLGKFLETQRAGFYRNITTSSYEYNGHTIPKGMKIIRAFKYFFTNKDAILTVQSLASQIIQKGKVEGKLCLSIHPLDFLSTSENTYGWRSCHALDGDYRSGNLSYMADNATMLCYIKGTEDARLPAFPPDLNWNSKKWRVLLFFNQDWDRVWIGRQYPFESHNALSYIIEHLFRSLGFALQPVEDGVIRHWTDRANAISYNLKDKYVPVFSRFHHVLQTKSEVISDFDNQYPLHYNDLLYSTCYEPKWANIVTDIVDTSKTVIGHPVQCLQCGEAKITSSAHMRCDRCELLYGTEYDEDITYCDCCGRRIYWDDTYEVGDDEHVCYDCYDEYYLTCDDCGCSYRKEEMTYDAKNDEYLCPWCVLEVEEEYGNKGF